MYRYLYYFVVLLVLMACNQKDRKAIDVSDVKVQVEIDRFDKAYYSILDNDITDLKAAYPYLFPEATPDSIWIAKIGEEQELFQKASKVFSNATDTENSIRSLFQHITHYHPDFKAPKIITLITGLDYRYKVQYADSLLFVSLDLYLGKNDEVYRDFPKYLRKNFEKEQLLIDMAGAIAERTFRKERNRQFLGSLVNEGKKMALIDHYLPGHKDAQKMAYTEEEYSWAEANEAWVWSYFLEKELLYSTESGLYERFIADAPFSKFYTSADRDAPGKIGVYLGWMIVRSYMKNNNVPLSRMLTIPAEELFKKSKYKPKR